MSSKRKQGDGVSLTLADTVDVSPKQMFNVDTLERYLVAHVLGF